MQGYFVQCLKGKNLLIISLTVQVVNDLKTLRRLPALGDANSVLTIGFFGTVFELYRKIFDEGALKRK